MPSFRFRRVVGPLRGARGYLDIGAGVSRGTIIPAHGSGPESPSESPFPPERMVWVFGAGRTGSTWISAMLGDLPRQGVWFEPRIGVAFDEAELAGHGGANFFFSERYRSVWLDSVRAMISSSAAARYPDLIPDGHLFVKDPAGSRGAPTVMAALPDSGLVLLVRDPRDVASSWLDASRKGGWKSGDPDGRERRADRDPDGFVANVARSFAKNVGGARKAFEAHGERKAIVRYEDLREDTFGTMRRMYDALGVPVDDERLRDVVTRHSWENIPEEQKGEGKFYRKARARGWEDDLTPKQARAVERITSHHMDFFGYG